MPSKGQPPTAAQWQRWERERTDQAGFAEAQRATTALGERLDGLRELLPRGVAHPIRLNFDAMRRQAPSVVRFPIGGKAAPAATRALEHDPEEEEFEPDSPSRLERLLPGWQARYEQRRQRGRDLFATAKHAWQQHELHLRAVTELNRRVDEVDADYQTGKPAAVRQALSFALATRSYPEEFPHRFSLVYRQAIKQLIIEYEFPDFARAIPTARGLEYQKTKKAFKELAFPLRERQQLYRELLSSLTLLTIHDLFGADRALVVERIAFIGVVDTIDKATGNPARPVLISLDVFRDAFADLQLSRVESIPALQRLRARVSPAPSELRPVDPVLVIDLTDPRRVEAEELLSTLSTNKNLLELDPYEFETIIRDLFQRMGYDTYQTRASRDGGVDCVAWYREPAGKRKTVIQAKRYSNPVPVSDVRDLLGAVQKERAGTGIIVTTSHFTRGAHEFAHGEQLVLWEGPQLLGLLHRHIGEQFSIRLPAKE